ncbi:SymE family type I addiction module toxin [Orbus wheelerorum]|uniref:SymE family type I addiction module toxin n=1 Tax=Orbus wheelerorum TaxID=3074111 RepID=UPI00370D0FD7
MRESSQRYYTVGYISVHHEPKSPTEVHYSKHPALHLKGNWLEQFGFNNGKIVIITAKKSKLIVEIAR